MRLARLHILSRRCPDCGLKINFPPAHQPHRAGSGCCQDRELQRQAAHALMLFKRLPKGGHFFPGQGWHMALALHLAGRRQYFAQVSLPPCGIGDMLRPQAFDAGAL